LPGEDDGSEYVIHGCRATANVHARARDIGPFPLRLKGDLHSVLRAYVVGVGPRLDSQVIEATVHSITVVPFNDHNQTWPQFWDGDGDGDHEAANEGGRGKRGEG